MSRKLALMLTVLCILLLYGHIPTAQAQPPVYVASVTEGKLVHSVRYTDANALAAQRALAFLSTGIPVYNAEWKNGIADHGAFSIYLDLGPDGDTSQQPIKLDYVSVPLATKGAPLTPADPTELRYVCAVTLNGVRDPVSADDFDYRLAMELSRCYPFAYTLGLPSDQFTEPGQSWWYDGVRTWMALQALGKLPAGIIGDIQSSYIGDLSSALYTLGTDTLYFWEALDQAKLSPADFITQVTSIDTFPMLFTASRLKNLSGQEDYNQGFMHSFALSLYAGTIPNQPSTSDLIDTSESVSGLPGEVSLELEPFSVRLMEIPLTGIDPQMGVMVTLESEPHEDNRFTRVSLKTPDSTVALSEGESYQFCYSDPTSLIVIASRGSVGQADQYPTLKLVKTQPCEPVLQAPECLYGTWNITGFSAFNFDPTGTWQISFADDGTGQIVAENLALGAPNTNPVVINYTIDLKMTFVQREKSASEVGIASWDATMQPGASASVTMPGGRVVDMTSAVVGGADAANNQMPPPVYIACDSQTAARIVVSAGGSRFTFSLRRAAN